MQFRMFRLWSELSSAIKCEENPGSNTNKYKGSNKSTCRNRCKGHTWKVIGFISAWKKL